MTDGVTGRALVLGGGGVTGIAWMLGLLTGLQRGGIDLTDADTVIGTSAGSVVGAQVTSGLTLETLYDEQLTPADREIGAQLGAMFLVRLLPLLMLPGTAQTKRRRVGLRALKARPESGDRRVEVISQRIGIDTWPERDLRVTAVEARTGRFRVLDRDSGVPVVHAVAASCAVPFVWPPVEIQDTAYVDGGVRSPANVDLASGADRVVVLAPLVQALGRASRPASQLERLRTAHSSLVSPDAEALAAIGKNVLDPSKRADAARTGLRQADEVADEVRSTWG